MSDIADLRRQLQEAGRYLLANDLTWGNAGNLSVRVDDNTCLITASGTSLGDLGEDDLVECFIEPAAPCGTGRKPSKKLPMHAAVYCKRPEVSRRGFDEDCKRRAAERVDSRSRI